MKTGMNQKEHRMSAAKTVRWDARAAWLEESRDQWKAKAQERTEEIKRLKVQVSDVQNSRSDWRGRAEDAVKASRAQAEQVEALLREVETLRGELEKKRRS
jgi:hypothetical protein